MKKSALEISKEIRNFEVSVTQVVEELISAIESVNPRINAVVEKRYEKALQEARLKDEFLKGLSSNERENLSPIFGVPFTCKEMISNEGMKSTLGSIHRRSRIKNKDATVVHRIRQAGGILLGTTNVPEVGFWFECDNVVYGCTKNPFDPERTSGGSSGGEGAIIGAGASTFGIGSDIGGSIRLPAAFCGIFGHKASDRLIPLTGHFPMDGDDASEITGSRYPFTVLGPMARTADDLETLFKLMIGPDGIDQNVKPEYQYPSGYVRNSEIQVHSLSAPVIHATSETEEDLSHTVLHATRYLAELGLQTFELPSRVFLRAPDLWTARTWTIESDGFTSYLADEKPIDFSREFLRLLMGKRNYTLPSLLTAVADRFASDRSEQESNLRELAHLKDYLTRKLGTRGVLLMPVHPRKAPLLNSTYTRPFDFSYTGIINALGFPSTAVPMGLSKEGLPLSLQVVAAENKDHLCFQIARLLEEGFGGYQPPRN